MRGSLELDDGTIIRSSAMEPANITRRAHYIIFSPYGNVRLGQVQSFIDLPYLIGNDRTALQLAYVSEIPTGGTEDYCTEWKREGRSDKFIPAKDILDPAAVLFSQKKENFFLGRGTYRFDDEKIEEKRLKKKHGQG